MRLETQLAIIDEARKIIKPLVNPVHRGNQIYKAPGKVRYREALHRLASVPYLAGQANALIKADPMVGGGDEFTLLESEIPAFQAALTNMTSTLSALSEALGNVVSPSTEDVLAIRLPPLSSLEELETFTRRVRVILSTIVLMPGPATKDAKLEFLGVETGTNWFKVSVGTAVAVSLVRLVCAMTQDIVRTVETFEAHAVIAKEVGAESSLAEDAKKVGDKIVERMILRDAKDLNNSYYVSDPEQEVRLAHALTELLQAVKQGTEIEKARGLPEDAPGDASIDRLKAVLEPRKQLTEAAELKKLPGK
jgi:hypothetical protein